MTILADHPIGLLWGYRFQGGRPELLRDGALPPDLDGADGWLWAHFPLADHRAQSFLKRLDMPEEAKRLLTGSEVSPRILFDGDWAYGVLADFEREFDGSCTEPAKLRFAFDGKRLITARQHACQIADEMHRALHDGRGHFPQPLDAFLALSRRFYEITEDQLDGLSDKLDIYEDRVLGGIGSLDGIELGPIRRTLSRRHREIAQMRTAYTRALTRQPQAHAHPLGQHLPQLMQHAEDIDREIASFQDRARLVHEEIDTKINNATNKTLRALTIMTALLMPPTLIAGAFGMNVGGIPFGMNAEGFALAAVLCAVSIAAAYWVLKRLRIL